MVILAISEHGYNMKIIFNEHTVNKFSKDVVLLVVVPTVVVKVLLLLVVLAVAVVGVAVLVVLLLVLILILAGLVVEIVFFNHFLHTTACCGLTFD